MSQPAAPAPQQGQETPYHLDLARHCLEMWAKTPQRPCDRELIETMAAWYENNQRWALAGLTAMVRQRLDEASAQLARSCEQGDAANLTRVSAKPEADGDAPPARSTRADRFARPRGG
ncbi:hypothetical protein [Ramlibacter sp. AN1133]|uniref:hypothetical protein n=1 Tax=Ramlibacter sp. AN1133 TaxID=3133429 RepID=UPI0030BB5CE9